MTSGQVASIVRSSRAFAFSCTLGATPWAEKTTSSPSGTSVSCSTKIAPRSASSCDDVLVVDDLLAHVDRAPVEIQRLLDRLHGTVDARAIAARGGEQDALRRRNSGALGAAAIATKGTGGPVPAGAAGH